LLIQSLARRIIITHKSIIKCLPKSIQNFIFILLNWFLEYISCWWIRLILIKQFLKFIEFFVTFLYELLILQLLIIFEINRFCIMVRIVRLIERSLIDRLILKWSLHNFAAYIRIKMSLPFFVGWWCHSHLGALRLWRGWLHHVFEWYSYWRSICWSKWLTVHALEVF